MFFLSKEEKFLSKEEKTAKVGLNLKAHIEAFPENENTDLSALEVSIHELLRTLGIESTLLGPGFVGACTTHQDALYALIQLGTTNNQRPSAVKQKNLEFINTKHMNDNIIDDVVYGTLGLIGLAVLPLTIAFYLITEGKAAPEALWEDIIKPTLKLMAALLFPIGMLISKYETDSVNLFDGKLRRSLKSIERLTRPEPEPKPDGEEEQRLSDMINLR